MVISFCKYCGNFVFGSGRPLSQTSIILIVACTAFLLLLNTAPSVDSFKIYLRFKKRNFEKHLNGKLYVFFAFITISSAIP